MFQRKEKDEIPEKQLNEVEIGKLPEKEFRIMLVKMIQDVGGKWRQRYLKFKIFFLTAQTKPTVGKVLLSFAHF